MNTISRFGSVLMLGMAALLPMRAMATDFVSPSDVEINFLDLYLSEKADCSNPIHVVHNTSTSTQNFIANPTLGVGSIPKGTYPCAIVGINSNITLTPAASTTSSVPPACQIGVPVTNQICRTGGHTVDPATGATINCVTGTATEVFGYFSTSGVSSGGGSRGLSPDVPLPLSSALVVSGDHTLQFVVDFDNTMEDFGGSSSCNTQAPTMSAR
jgi:hypothetical protein